MNSGILYNAEPLSETQEGQLQKEVLANKKAFAYLNSNKELCFALPHDPRCIKDLAWDHAQYWYMNGTTIDMNAYRRSGVGAHYLYQQYYCAATESAVATLPKIPLTPTPAASGLGLAAIAEPSGSYITGYIASSIPDSGIVYIPAYIDGVKVTQINASAFAGCDKLTYVNIPPTIAYIGLDVFGGCTKLTHIDLGNCEALCNMISSEVTVATPFTNTVALQAISVAPDNKKYKSVDGVLFEILNIGLLPWSNLVAYPAGKPDATYTVPQNVSIMPGAFYGCPNLTTVNMQNIGFGMKRNIFYHCDNLTDIVSTLTRNDFASSSYGETFWWQPSDSSKAVTIHCSDGTLTATTTGYIYN